MLTTQEIEEFRMAQEYWDTLSRRQQADIYYEAYGVDLEMMV